VTCDCALTTKSDEKRRSNGLASRATARRADPKCTALGSVLVDLDNTTCVCPKLQWSHDEI